MPNVLDALHCLQFLRGKLIAIVAVDKLNGLINSAGSPRAPDFGVSPGSYPLNELIAGENRITSLHARRHGTSYSILLFNGLARVQMPTDYPALAAHPA